MPYKSEKIKIEGSKYDRRIKLSRLEKEEICKKYYEQGMSMRALSREYGVDRQVIKYTIFPEYKLEFYKANRERKHYLNTTKDQRNKYARSHRKYKQELYKKGLIKNERK